MTTDEVVATKLAEALTLLLDYIDERPDEATADDDVKALEDMAFVLQATPANHISRLVALLGERRSVELGLTRS